MGGEEIAAGDVREEEKLSWSDPWLQAIDLEYHNIQPDQGLFYELLRQGSIRHIVSEKEIKDAIFSPPETTRAYFRGRSVARFNHAISSIQWDEIAFKNGARSQLVTLPSRQMMRDSNAESASQRGH